MKKLTEKEIKFIKETGWTPTVYQMNYNESELKHTKFAGLSREEGAKAFHKEIRKHRIKIDNLYKKCTSEVDGITLENDAVYLLYTFFKADELVDIDTSWALQWLQDFKYYEGFRKWSERDVENAICEALEVYGDSREFYEDAKGEIWTREVE